MIFIICEPPGAPFPAENLGFNPLDGTVIADSAGNGDGQLNPGERASVRLRVTNVSKEALPAFSLVMTTREPDVKLSDDRVRFDRLDQGETALSEDPFEFALGEDYFFDCVRFIATIESAKRGAASAGTQNGGGVSAQNGNSFAVDVSVYPNYRVCLGTSTVKEGAVDDTVTISLKLCNSANATLTSPSVKIDSITVKRCDLPGAAFKVVRKPVLGGTARLDTLTYDDVPLNQCKFPKNPTLRFAFAAPNLVTQGSDTSMCVYFGAKVYSGGLLRANRNMGIEARIIRVTPPPAD